MAIAGGMLLSVVLTFAFTPAMLERAYAQKPRPAARSRPALRRPA